MSPVGASTLHRSTGRAGLGFGLACTTMLLWGTLPLALKGALQHLDPAAITWARFVAAALALAALLAARGQLPAVRRFGRGEWILLGTATVFLAANYLGYIVALDLSSAADAQVLIQLAPLLLALGGIAVFGERFTRLQWLGFAVLIAGMTGFFAAQLAAIAGDVTRYLSAVAILTGAAVTWAVYGLAQKQLLLTLSSQGVMLCIYAGCALLFAPLATPAAVGSLNAPGALLLAFCAANTVVAYGTFAESLEHWEASRVSAVLALTPLATLGFSALADLWWPALEDAAPLPVESLVSAGLVVMGSLATALGGRDTG